MVRAMLRQVGRVVTGTVLVVAALAVAWVLVLSVALDDTREPDEPVTYLDSFERDGRQVEQLGVRTVDDVEGAFALSVSEADRTGPHVVELYCVGDLDRRVTRNTFTVTTPYGNGRDARTTDVDLQVVEEPGC